MLATRLVIALVASAAIGTVGCRLEEVALAPPEDVVVAEVFLQAGEAQQFAFLHRSLGTGALTVPNAVVELTGPDGRVAQYSPAAGIECVNAGSSFLPDTVGSCYATTPAVRSLVSPGATYSLRIRLPGGGQLTGTTTVPGAFRLKRPSVAQCKLAPGTLLPMEWTRSVGAWVYLSETRLAHVRKALDPNATNDRSLDMTGLSISAEDTTIVFPSEFGLFDRFNDKDAPVLLALQKGLPEGVTATVTVSAADRNYVQWVRRGTFNPSGTVQIPSLQGDGTGVFGSLAPARFDLTSVATSPLPPC